MIVVFFSFFLKVAIAICCEAGQESRMWKEKYYQAVKRADNLDALVANQALQITQLNQQLAKILDGKSFAHNEQQVQIRERCGEDMKQFEVGDILDMRYRDEKREFLIHWKGFSPNGDTWEPEEYLNCDDILKEFFERSDFLLDRDNVVEEENGAVDDDTGNDDDDGDDSDNGDD